MYHSTEGWDMADSAQQLLRSGPDGVKTNLVVLGDGFTAGEQDAFNDYISKHVMEEVFGHGPFAESKQAFNITRVNLESTDSGVTRHRYQDGSLVSRDDRDTALDTIYTGSWNRCWMERGPNTKARLDAALDRWADDVDYVLVVLNEAGAGGCARGNELYVTLGVDWTVVAHEFGHGLGGLADEYCRPGAWAGRNEPPNLTTTTERAKVKWKRFIRPGTPVPTGVAPNPGSGSCARYNQGDRPGDWSSSGDVGLFEGGGTRDSKVYRPVENCRMNGNRPPFCPVCHTHIKDRYHATTEQTFERVFVGDFNGSGRDDLLIHNRNAIQIYRANGSRMEMAFNAVGRVPGSWQFAPNDQFFIGDVNGDGKDEVVVVNTTDWNTSYLGLLTSDGADGLRLTQRYDGTLPGWQLGRHDQFQLADFTGDGNQDLVVFNGADWTTPYLGLLRSTGSGFTRSHRYDGSVEGWSMRPGDSVLTGDFDGSGRQGVCMVNTRDWSTPYLGLMTSNGARLSYHKRYDGSLPGWQMAAGDQFYVGDFNGDGRDDLYVFNGTDWSTAYLGMLGSEGDEFRSVRRYDGNAPGWQMRKHDHHFVADIDGNGSSDLFVYNAHDWDTEYLGTMVSTGNALTCRWSSDRVGQWNLGRGDRFEVCNYEGVAGSRNLVVHNRQWLGLLRATPTLSLQRIYKNWIHNYSYGRNW